MQFRMTGSIRGLPSFLIMTATLASVLATLAGPAPLAKYVEKIAPTLIEFEMLPMPAGSIEIADSKTGAPTRVALKPFWIGKTEVTWDEYDVFNLKLDLNEAEARVALEAKTRPSRPYGAPDYGFGHAGYAAMSISFFAADQYCQWLAKRTGKKYRLPTEAEWEYAARAGAIGRPDKAMLEKVAWFWDNADDCTHPAGKKQPNAWGLFDTLGNVREWAIGLDKQPVACGGSFMDEAKDIHASARHKPTPEWNKRDPQEPKGKWWLSDGPFMGFRLVRDAD
jgi:formylglycine-generating enzyme required for sulfatase activity